MRDALWMHEDDLDAEIDRLRARQARAGQAVSTERELLLELAAAVSRLLRDYDRAQFPRDADWTAHQGHAWKLDELANKVAKDAARS